MVGSLCFLIINLIFIIIYEVDKTSLYPLVLFIFFAVCAKPVQAQAGEAFLKLMHERYKDKWFSNMIFSQLTEFYRNDSLIKQETWQEAVRFPYELRIDFGYLSQGNSVIYKKDSTFRFKNGVLQGVSTDNNPFILFLGGMYFLPYDTVVATLKKRGYNTSNGTVTNWQGRKTYIIGANEIRDSTSNQFWIDAENFYVVRVIFNANNAILDVQLSDHIKMKNGWTETKVVFFRNGKLIQKEFYKKIEVDKKLNANLFNTRFYSRNTWGPVFIEE